MSSVIVDDLGQCKVKLHFEIPAEEVNKEVESIYLELAKTAKVPGFRPGKVPRKILEARYKNDVVDESQKRIITRLFQDAIKEKNLNPVNSPKIENMVYAYGSPMSFTADFEVVPKINLKNYEGVPVTVAKYKVEEAEIESEVEYLRDSCATLESVEGRPVVKGDYVFIDYKIMSMDETLIEEGNSKLMFMSDDNNFLSGVISDMEGMEIGESKKIKSVLPENYVKKAFAGADVFVAVTVNEIKEKVLPALDDEFVKSIGSKFNNVEELRSHIAKMIDGRKKMDQKSDGKSQIAKKLLSDYDFELPQSVVDAEIKNVLREKMSRNHKGETDPVKATDEIIIEAKDRVKVSYILAEIAEKENIKALKNEVEDTVRRTAYSLNVKYERLMDHLEEHGGIYEVQERIIQDKVLDLLYSKAKVVEK